MKLKLISILILLITALKGNAQHTPNKFLSKGDPAPPLSAFKWLKGEPVSVLAKGKAYVVEFGATWCAPCAAAIPKLSALADKHKTELTVLSFFVMERSVGSNRGELDYVSNVEKYVQKRADKISYAVAVDGPEKIMEATWLRATGNISVPLSFVVDKDGTITFIGSDITQLTNAVETVLSTGYAKQPDNQPISTTKEPIPFDTEKLLLLEGNGGNENNFAFRSIIQKYDGTIAAGNPEYINSFRGQMFDDAYLFDRVQVVGVSLASLYYLAYGDTISNQVHSRNYLHQYPDTIKYPNSKTSYGKYWHLPVLQMSDVAAFKVDYKAPANRYNYSLKVPAGLGTAKFLQEAMRNDLKTYFGYEVSVETQEMPYWKLVQSANTPTIDTLKSKNQEGAFQMIATDDPYYFTSADMRDLIWTLGSWYGYGRYDYGKLLKNDQTSFADETNINYKIDFTFDRRWSFDEWKKYLNTIGLDLVKSKKSMKVIVIRDAKY